MSLNNVFVFISHTASIYLTNMTKIKSKSNSNNSKYELNFPNKPDLGKCTIA